MGLLRLLYISLGVGNICFYLVLFDIIYCIYIYVKIGMLMIKVVLLVIEF